MGDRLVRFVSGSRRRAGGVLVVVVLVASSVALAGGAAVAQEPEGSQPPPAAASAGALQAGSGGWWDGTATLVAAPPPVEVGVCDSYGGSLGLFAGGPLTKVCAGEEPDAVPGPVSGSPRGVGWFEGFDAGDPLADGSNTDGSYVGGPYAGVELFGVAGVTAVTYQALGELDVVFGGGTFTADFSACTYRAGSGWSSCRVLGAGAPLPPGSLVGVAAAGTELPTNRRRGFGEGTETPPGERAALVALYDATDGANWLRNTNWNTTVPVSDWYGVTTDTNGAVTRLYLYNNSLVGSIPAALGDLPNLVSLNLAGKSSGQYLNELSGSIPVELGDLTNLEELTLDGNNLSGSIPAALGGLANLRVLNVLGNGLSGPVPAALGDLTNLVSLNLGSNSLSGSIPAALGGLTGLDFLSLAGNGLSGSIPAALGDLTNLRRFYLSRNDLSGSIPAALGDLTSLQYLILSDNELSGGIPAALGGLTALEHLVLSRNELSGPIPAALGDLTNLDSLDFSSNGLSESIPPELGDLTNLTWLLLYDNELSGSIPPELGDLTNLTWLLLYDNELSGSIPPELGDLTNLLSLQLQRNTLSGTIPAALGDLTNLETLWLDGNSLSGSIPADLGDLTNLTWLLLYDNELSGSIPPELGDLTNVEEIRLNDNDLSGPIPAELADLTNLTWLYLYSNDLSGCVPAALAAVPVIRFDADLAYCGPVELIAAVLVGGAAVELIYDQALDESSTPAVDAFTVTADSADQTISSVTIAGTKVNLTLASPITSTQVATVTYTVPTANGDPRIETTAGDAAPGFTDEPVTIPPDPPTITSVESLTGGLTVTWTPAGDINGYDVEWRQDAETTWQSTRTGLIGEYTISGLTDDALYWVRVRAVKTDGDLAGQTIFTTAWSQAEPGIAGDWAPRNLQVTPGDRSLTVTWEGVDAADYEVDYEVLYQPQAEAAGSGGTAGRISDAARSIATDDFAVARPVSAVLGDQGWAAHIIGIDNGSTYEVQVRAVRTVTTPSGNVTSRSAPASTEGTHALAFEIRGRPSGPRVVWSGGDVTWELELSYPILPPRADPLPFANQPIRVRVAKGPSTGTSVRCVPTSAVSFEISETLGPACVTDVAGKVKLQYRAAAVRTTAEVGVDELVVFAAHAATRCSTSAVLAECKTVGSTKIARPINLVALGDSYSAGENGNPRLDRSRGFTGYYLSESGIPATGPFLSLTGPVDAPCRRWSEAYSRRLGTYFQPLPGLPPTRPLRISDSHGFWACTGAISLNLYYPTDLQPDHSADQEPVVYRTYDLDILAIESASDPAQPPIALTARTTDNEVRRPSFVATSRPSPAYGSESRQGNSLAPHRVELREVMEDVDMVVLTIGGNDMDFASILDKCIRDFCFELNELPSGEDYSFDPSEYSFNVADLNFISRELGDDTYTTMYSAFGYYFEPMFAELAERLDSVFARLGISAGKASVFVLGYPHLVPNELDYDETCGRLDSLGWGIDVLAGLGLSAPERAFIRAGNVALNATVRAAAERAGFHFVPVAEDVFEGHETCTNEAAWVNGLERDILGEGGASRRSFHPNQLGHLAYASALLSYIGDAIDEVTDPGAELNAGGLPVNPGSNGVSGGSGERSARAGGVVGASGGVRGAEGQGADSGGGESEESTGSPSVGPDFVVRGVLVPRRAVPAVLSCGVGFVSPGEVMVLEASGFAAGASVAVVVRSATAPWATVSESSLPAATADDGGGLEVRWTAPAGAAGSAPSAYVFEASGAGASGGTLVARSFVPVVVYPAVAPCAVVDAASTTVGRAVRVGVLGNDVAPGGGSLVAASVTVDAVYGASVSVDGTDGAVTVAPDPGFVGTIVVPYRVRDSWGIGVDGAVIVSVEAGCTITGTAGVELIEGTDGDDVICVADLEDWEAFHVIDAKGGDDVVIGGDGVEWIRGGAGSDVIYGRAGADRIDGGPGPDVIYGGVGRDTVLDADLSDVVHDDVGGYDVLLVPPGRGAHVAPITGDDAAHVGAGQTVDIAVLDNDHDRNENLVATSLSVTQGPTLGTAHGVVPAGGDVVVRYVAGDSSGVDTLVYEICDTLDACATAVVTVTVGAAGCTIVGTDGDDTLSGTAGPDVICGLAGDDVIYGLGGDDVLVGGPGDDALYGGDESAIGDDGADVLFGGPGDDRLFGGAGADTLWGGPGGDALAGNRGEDSIHGGAGDDIAVGGGEDDVLWGGAGDDNLDGHAANDTLHGGPGRDILRGGNGDDVLWGGAGNDQLTGGAGSDTLWGGADIDLLWGNTQNDTLHGGAGFDILRGGGGDDRLTGGAGDDQLHGNAGDDRLWGDAGDDSLDGGNGSDYVDGSDGGDTCTRGDTVARCES